MSLNRLEELFLTLLDIRIGHLVAESLRLLGEGIDDEEFTGDLATDLRLEEGDVICGNAIALRRHNHIEFFLQFAACELFIAHDEQNLIRVLSGGGRGTRCCLACGTCRLGSILVTAAGNHCRGYERSCCDM